MKIRHLLAVMTAVLLLAACSVSTDSGKAGGGSEDSGSNAIPQSGSVDQISKIVHETMKGKKIGWVPIGMGIPLTENWTSELKRGFSQLGADLIIRDANWDAAKMPDIVDGLINSKVDVLILHNPDVGVLTSQIQRAKAAGIYVIAVNLMPSQQADAFIGGDFRAMGADLAKSVVANCDKAGKTKVAAVDGYGTDGASVAAREGWDSVFKGSDIKVVSQQSANYLPTDANKVARTVLQQHGDLCAFIGNWDTMMLGVSQAVAQAGKTGQVGVYTLDASAPSCANIKNGTLTMAMSYGVPAMGGAIVSLAEDMLQSGSTPGATRSALFMPYQVVDKSNVDQIALACYGNQ